jgi:hypothetical protein
MRIIIFRSLYLVFWWGDESDELIRYDTVKLELDDDNNTNVRMRRLRDNVLLLPETELGV